MDKAIRELASRFNNGGHTLDSFPDAMQRFYNIRVLFCALSDDNGKVLAWMVNGMIVARDEFQPAEDVIREPIRGKGRVPNSDFRSVMVAYHTPVTGNGTDACLQYRTWGAPVIGVAAIEGVG